MEKLLTIAEVVEATGLTKDALASKRYTGTGPRFVKLGAKSIRYREADVTAWIESRLATQTGQVA